MIGNIILFFLGLVTAYCTLGMVFGVARGLIQTGRR